MIPITPHISAVLDTCVLFPNSLRDTLFRATQANLYRAYLTEDIMVELERNLVKAGAVKTPEQARHLMGMIRMHLRHTFVTGYDALIPALTNDEKDRHVLAAAIQAGAQIIVTFNLKDFPRNALMPHGVAAQHPDEFLSYLHDRDPGAMARVIVKQSEALTRLPMTVPEVLQALLQHVPHFVARMYTYLWEADGLPLDRHTRDLYTKLRHRGADIPPMHQDSEHRR